MDKVIRSQYRIPSYLVAWLKQKARDNTRSLNGELVQTLKRAYQKDKEA